MKVSKLKLMARFLRMTKYQDLAEITRKHEINLLAGLFEKDSVRRRYKKSIQAGIIRENYQPVSRPWPKSSLFQG